MCDSPGILDRVSVTRSSISPAITKVCPLPSSTKVSMRRVESAGMVKPAIVTEFARSMVETSGFTYIRIVSCPVISGLNVSRMPNSLNMMVTAPTFAPPCTTGSGNSPPTRKLASLPLVATRFGSARICNNCLLSSARMNAAKFRSGRNANTFSASAIENSLVAPKVPAPIAPLSSAGRGGENCPVVVLPMVLAAPVEIRLTPNASAAARFSSANFTLSSTCFSGPAEGTWRLFTTTLANGAISAAARSATAGLETTPTKESESLAAWTSMFSLGNVSLRRRRAGSRSCSTTML